MKLLEGLVKSVKMTGTATVLVERKKMHPLYGKSVKRSKKYHAAFDGKLVVGSRVKIKETRPISRTKRWEVL